MQRSHRDYYTSEEASMEVAARAGLKPTPAVIHVAGRDQRQNELALGKGMEIVPIALSQPGLLSLIISISQDFERPTGYRAEAISEGLTLKSYFYSAKGEFHLFNTCNTWSAKKLMAGGVEVSPSGIVTAEDLMRALRGELPDLR